MRRKLIVLGVLLTVTTLSFAGDKRKRNRYQEYLQPTAAQVDAAKEAGRVALAQLFAQHQAQMDRDCPPVPEWKNCKEFDMIADDDFAVRARPHVDERDPDYDIKIALLEQQWQAHLLKHPLIHQRFGRHAK